ncbi:oxygenase MpaB family protein [Nocardia sp. NPDC001965]
MAERVVPACLAAFRSYLDNTVAEILERNSTTELLLALDRHPMPPHPRFPMSRWIWNIPAVPVAALLRLTTAGYLPAVLRGRLGIGWDAGRARRFVVLVTAANAEDRGLPPAAGYPLRGRTNPATGASAAGCPHAGDR